MSKLCDSCDRIFDDEDYWDHVCDLSAVLDVEAFEDDEPPMRPADNGDEPGPGGEAHDAPVRWRRRRGR